MVALSSARPVTADLKRDAPDYDGRGNTDADAGSWALWIPRLALSPLYLVNEYAVRRPLGGLVTTAERRHWVNAVSDFRCAALMALALVVLQLYTVETRARRHLVA